MLVDEFGEEYFSIQTISNNIKQIIMVVEVRYSTEFGSTATTMDIEKLPSFTTKALWIISLYHNKV